MKYSRVHRKFSKPDLLDVVEGEVIEYILHDHCPDQKTRRYIVQSVDRDKEKLHGYMIYGRHKDKMKFESLNIDFFLKCTITRIAKWQRYNS